MPKKDNRPPKNIISKRYFNENAKDIRKTWTGIKNIVNIQRTTKTNFNANRERYLNTSLDSNFVLRSSDTGEIILIIDSSASSKVTRPHSIPTEILKLINLLFQPLKEKINLSFATGKYPNKLTIAKVFHIIVSNYRPISFLSNINKIFEKLLYSRLYSFLSLHNCIYDLQFGCRETHLKHALFSLTEMVRDSLDNGNFAGGIFIDL